MKKTALCFQCTLETILGKKLKRVMYRPGGELKAETGSKSETEEIYEYGIADSLFCTAETSNIIEQLYYNKN